MYGLQLDQLAAVLGVTQRRASAIVAGWNADGLADAARLGPGQRWVWLTRAGLASCGLPYLAGAPGLARLAHLRAVTAIRLALAATELYAAGNGYWRSERRLRARIGGRIGLREHVPDGELHWPDGAQPTGLDGTGPPWSDGEQSPWFNGAQLRRVDVTQAPRPDGVEPSWPDGGQPPWAGECWAIEAELTPKTLARTAGIMTELLTRTGDYGCSAADARVPGRPPRHARAIYLCSPAAYPVVRRARAKLGALGARVEIRALPDGAELPIAQTRAPASSARSRSRPASAVVGRPTARTEAPAADQP